MGNSVIIETAEFQNVFLSLKTLVKGIQKDMVFKIYFKSSIFPKHNAVGLRFEIVSNIKLSV